ncbi:MAG: type II secretion system F family protein [Candidatus Pacebacteria bacterium]|nr:type II secretion system F family protein [Candidatus Paceibacterota bacterium]
MKFSYKARNANNTASEGVIEARDKVEAINELRNKGLTPIFINQSSGGLLGKLNSISFGAGNIKLSEKILMTKNLSGMLKAGLSISRALQVLSKQTRNKYFKQIIEDLSETINKGGTFSDGLAKYPKVFSALFVAMVKAGEESGGLPNTLSEIGVTLEKSYALNKKIKSAMMYPSIILGAIFIIGILMFVYVVPTLTKTFKELGTELPASTKIVVWISDTLANNFLFVVLGIVSVVFIVIFALKNAKVKRKIDWLVIRLPVIGTIVKEVNTARTTRTMSSLLSSGVSIGRAIGITKEVLQNVYYKAVLAEVEEVVQKGVPISSVFKAQTKLYPVMMGEMIEVGEETGNLGDMLLEVATFYETEVDNKTKDLSTIIEPVLMIFIGVAVGFFAISMLSPMYSIMDSIN